MPKVYTWECDECRENEEQPIEPGQAEVECVECGWHEYLGEWSDEHDAPSSVRISDR